MAAEEEPAEEEEAESTANDRPRRPRPVNSPSRRCLITPEVRDLHLFSFLASSTSPIPFIARRLRLRECQRRVSEEGPLPWERGCSGFRGFRRISPFIFFLVRSDTPCGIWLGIRRRHRPRSALSSSIAKKNRNKRRSGSNRSSCRVPSPCQTCRTRPNGVLPSFT